MEETQGIHGTGTTKYTSEQQTQVVSLVTLASMMGTQLTVADIHEATGYSGNAIRSMLSDADGRMMLLGGNGKGYLVVSSKENAEQLTKRLESQVQAMQERISRRREYMET